MAMSNSIAFSSQAELFPWICHCRTPKLAQIHELKLQIVDVDLSSLLQQDGDHDPRVDTATALYQRELEQFNEALQALPSLRHVELAPPANLHSHLARGLYLSVAKLALSSLPKLERLTVCDNAADTAATLHLRDHLTVVDVGKRAGLGWEVNTDSGGKGEIDSTCGARRVLNGKAMTPNNTPRKRRLRRTEKGGKQNVSKFKR